VGEEVRGDIFPEFREPPQRCSGGEEKKVRERTAGIGNLFFPGGPEFAGASITARMHCEVAGRHRVVLQRKEELEPESGPSHLTPIFAGSRHACAVWLFVVWWMRIHEQPMCFGLFCREPIGFE